MGRKRISSSDLIWMFHQKLQEYGDHPFHGIALAIISIGNGNWEVITQRKLPRRKPDMATRISAIEKQLRKQYTLAADGQMNTTNMTVSALYTGVALGRGCAGTAASPLEIPLDVTCDGGVFGDRHEIQR